MRGARRGGIGPEAFDGIEVRGKAVLVRTGWDAHWGTPRYLSGNPFLTADAAARISWSEGQSWSASTRSTSTTFKISRDRFTRHCSARTSRSSSTSAISVHCLLEASAFRPCRPRSSDSAPGRCAPSPRSSPPAPTASPARRPDPRSARGGYRRCCWGPRREPPPRSAPAGHVPSARSSRPARECEMR